MANMYQFTAGAGGQSYTYPPAQQQQQYQGTSQQYQQTYPSASYPPNQQYYNQNQQHGLPHGNHQAYQAPTIHGNQPHAYTGLPGYQISQVNAPHTSPPPQTPYAQPPGQLQYPPNNQAAFPHPRKHSAPQSQPQACYNCGGLDHFAQNCPEPRRAVPA